MENYKDLTSSQVADLAEEYNIDAIVELARRYLLGTYILLKDSIMSDFWIEHTKFLANNDISKLAEIEETVKGWKDENNTNNNSIIIVFQL